MKRKYIKPVTTVLMVETQNNYCQVTSWTVGKKFHDDGQVEVENPATDMGRVKTDKDLAADEYNPWDSKNW